MDKIWIVRNKNSYAKKFKIYKSEAELLKVIGIDSNVEILEYNLDNIKTAADFFKNRDRDLQLRNILGELDKFEQCAADLISLYDELAPIGRTIKRFRHPDITEKEIMLSKLKKYQSERKLFSKFLVDNKKQLFSISNEVRWYKAILLCHNFRDHIIYKKWDNASKTYIDKTPDEIKNNFLLAKSELKSKK